MSEQIRDAPAAGQAMAIELPCAARAFVVAGPGAGKTWTLLRRARHLIEHDDLGPSNLLVLSFTRAVVRELRRRDRAGNAAPGAFPETFDAFAGRLLRAHATDDRWKTQGFEARIVLATELIRNRAAQETLRHIDHIFVDEVQDLVGARAAFVKELLVAHPGGFTAFGDPAQAIYEDDDDLEEATLITMLEGGLASRVVHLGVNYRSSGVLADTIDRVRQSLLESDDGAEVAMDAMLELDTLGSFADLPTLLPTLRGNVAVLCRDNASVLLLSRALHEVGVDHRVRRGSADRPVAGWVAAAFGTSSRLSHAQFERRLGELGATALVALPDPNEGWRVLSRLDPGARGGAIRASEVGTRLAVGRIPYELYDEPDHPLVLSSIHRAKGLEFDACVVVEWPRRDGEDALLEARVFFVALSRARRDCLHAGVRDVRAAPWFRAADAFGRFVKCGHRRGESFGIEIQGGDVHDTEPGGIVGISCDTAAVQARLVGDVRPGDAVVLSRIGLHDFGRGARPLYAVHHEAGPIGVTGSRFGDALRRRLGHTAPARITDVRVDDMESIKGHVDGGDAAGLGRSGMWLRPRLVGLGEFHWKAS